MATRYYETSFQIIKTDRDATLTNLYDSFHQFDNRFTVESGTGYIVFNNMVKLDIIAASSSGTPTWRYLNPLDTVVISSTLNFNGSYTARIVITEHGFLCRATTTSYSNANFILFFYIKDNNTAYINLSGNSGTNNIDSYSNTYRMNTNGVGDVSGYGFQKICNVQLVSPYVLFSTANVITTSNGNFAVLDDFRSCSVVSPFSTVTINNKNYMAIGTNTLVEAPAT